MIQYLLFSTSLILERTVSEGEKGHGWLLIVATLVVLAAVAAWGFYFFKVAKEKGAKSVHLPRESATKPLTDLKVAPVPARGGILVGNAQDIGRRKDQQDSFALAQTDGQSGLLALLADGMGGLSNGKAYSELAVQAARDSFQKERPEKNDESTLLRILRRARDAIADAGLSDGGTTFVAALIRDQQLHFLSVGDSRICLMRNGGLIQLNREHVYGRELDDLAANGLLDREEAEQDVQRAAITSYLGSGEELRIDRNIEPVPLFSGDKVVLMSDGVFGYLPEEELTECLLKKPMKAAEAVRSAVLAQNHPHQDNMTIIILEIE